MTTPVTILVEDVPANGKVIKLVKVNGQLDESNVDDQAQKIYKLLEETPKGLSLIFDFAGLEYMNSKSIGYLTDWYSKTSATGGQIVITAARENILDILQVVGLTQLITNYPTLDEAKKAVM